MNELEELYRKDLLIKASANQIPWWDEAVATPSALLLTDSAGRRYYRKLLKILNLAEAGQIIKIQIIQV